MSFVSYVCCSYLVNDSDFFGQINMDSDVFRSSRPSSQRWRAVVSVVLDDMGATDCTLEEAGCDLFIYLDTVHGSVMGLIIAEQVCDVSVY